MLQRSRRRCEGAAMGAITLELRPGVSLGPFTLGMPICEAFAHIEQHPSIYDVVHVKYHDELADELWFTVGGQHLPFGASPQDVWSELGRPCGIHQKQVDQMVIHSASDPRPRTTLCGDYFYNYFARGLDILFDGQTHKIKKFVLHTNFPGHADFNSYIKCNFVIHCPQSDAQNDENVYDRCITPNTKWHQVKVHVTFSYAATPEFHETDIRMKPDLDALGAQGDIGWYCCRAILWANEYQMPQSVRAMPGPKFNSAGVVVSCGATFEWEDGRLATYHVSFLSHMTMNLIVQGTKGTLHVEDFCIPFEETWASFKFISGMKFKQLALGWENKPEEQKVTVEKPQEVVMIEEISTIVKNVRDGVGKADPHWPTIARKTQVLVNAVMESIHSNFSTIQI